MTQPPYPGSSSGDGDDGDDGSGDRPEPPPPPTHQEYGRTRPEQPGGYPPPGQQGYGQAQYPQQPYGQQPAYGQPTYGSPAYHAWQGRNDGRRGTNGTSIAAFVLNLTPCGLVIPGWVCAVIGLRQIKRDGTKGRWAAITSLVLGAIWALVIGALVVGGVWIFNNAVTPDNVEAGTCVNSDDIAEGSSEIGLVTETDCDGDHDGEIYAVHEVTAEESEQMTDFGAGALCFDELTRSGADAEQLATEGLEPFPIVSEEQLEEGDKIACTLRHRDGEKLTRQYVVD